MNHTHNNIIAKAKRLVASVLLVALCLQDATPALAITFDSATSTYFDVIDDFGLAGGSTSIGLQFGGTLGEYLRFDQLLGKFVFTDDLDVQGTISGARLTIMGNASISGALTIEGGSAALSGSILRGFGLNTDCDTAGTSKLLWDATTGRFSCGTDTDTNTTYTAGQGLNLSGTSLRLNTTVTGAVIQAANSLASSGSLSWKGIGSGGRLDVGGGTIQIAANGSAVFNENSKNLDYRFEGDGNANLLFLDASSDRVGIGTATPNYNVEIHGGTAFSYISLINNASGFSANDGFQFGLEADASAAYILMRENGPLHFRTNNTDKMSILANGNVGINTTAARTKLDVVGAISGSFIYATRSFSGAGLSDCDTGATSKLLWDATTGRFSCGTDQSGAGGLSLSDADARYVNTHGDTMTGSLRIDNAHLLVEGSGSFIARDPADVVLTVRGSGSQTGNLQQWVDTTNTMFVNIGADGTLNTQSNVSIGSDTSDNVTFNADVNTHINPDSNNAYDLGNTSNRWAYGYFNNANLSGDLSVLGSSIMGDSNSDTITFNADVNTSINPDANVSYNLGSDSYRWNYVYGGNGNFSGEIYGAGVGNVANVTMRNVTSCNGSWSLATDMNGNVYCDTDDTGAGWGTDYFNIYDGATTETIDEGNTITFTDGTNIDVSVSMTDTVTIGINNAYINDVSQYLNTGSDPTFNNITMNGNVAIGSDTSDTFALNALGNTSYLLSQNNAYDLGNTTNRWATGYFANMNISDTMKFGDTVTDTIDFHAGAWTFNNSVNVTFSGGVAANFDSNTLAIIGDTDSVGIGTGNPKTKLEVVGAISGSFIYATQSFSGAGLSDCDTAGTSKLLWDATTGRFSCGTDQTGGSSGGSYFAGQGLSLNGANSFSVNATLTGSLARFSTVSGATVFARNALNSSGTLLIHPLGDQIAAKFVGNAGDEALVHLEARNMTNGTALRIDTNTGIAGPVINVYNNGNDATVFGVKEDGKVTTLTGAVMADGSVEIKKEGNGSAKIGVNTLSPTTTLEVVGAISGSFIYATRSFSGAGLSDCDTAGTSKLLWDATTGRFSCGTDQGAAYTAGQGLTLNGTSFRLNAAVTGSTIHAVSRLSSSGSAIIHGNGADFTVFNSVDELKPSIIAKTVSSAASQVFLNAVTGDNAASDGLEFGSYYGNAFLMNRETAGIILGTANAYHVGINSAGSVGIGGAYNVFDDPLVDSKLEVVGTISGASVYATDSFSAPNSTLKMAGHVIPTIDGFFTLGTDANSWFEVVGDYGKFGNGFFSSKLSVGTTSATKATMDVVGVLSGVTLYATKSFSGAGLSDCDNATTSKLLWDATTGRFSCGTDQTGGSSGGGMAYATASGIFLKRSGGTMTGGLTVLKSGSTSDRGITVAQHNDGIHGAPLLFMKSRGTVTSPTTVASGDYGGFFQYGFYTGGTNNGGYTRTATIATIVNGAVSTSNGGTAPTDIIFAAGSTDDPNITTTERMRITSTGNVGIATSSPHSTFTASGSFATRARVMTATGSINGHDNVIFASGSSMITVTLPSAVGIAGRQYTIKKTSSTDNTNMRRVIVATTSSQTIDRVANWKLLNRGQEVTVMSDGANWQTVGGTSTYGLNGGFVSMGTTMNQWYGAPADATALTTAVLTTTATIRVLPFVAQKVMTINGMSVSVQTTAASAEVRLALYSDSGRGYPDQLVVDAGTVTTTSTGQRSICPSGCTTVGASALPVTIQPGLYWIAINNNSIAHTLRGYAVANLNPVSGFPSAYTTLRNVGWQVANAYGAYPATFPTAATATTAAPLPVVTMRFQE